MKPQKLYLLSAFALAALASCQNPVFPSLTVSDHSSSQSKASEGETSKEVSSEVESSKAETISSKSEQSDVDESSSEATTSPGYTVYDPTNDRVGINWDAGCFSGLPCLDTIGTQNVLVVPVAMSDAPSFSQADLNAIDKAYNGDADETGWQSLKSYYEASSYGQLELNCIIASPYTVSYSTSSFQRNYNSDASFFGEFLEEVVDHAFQSLNQDDFDQNHDGYIDGLQIVYKNNGTEWTSDSTAIWWNFTSTTELDPSVDSPVPGVYFWSQFSMIKNGYYQIDIDAHTLVHEMGHMLGVDDFYSYDEDGAPAGCADMMDWNVGDHNAVTKTLFGWVKPYVPDGTKDEFTITLRDFESSGDCLMLIDPNSWNGTAFDEYFMLEYYTPTGMNEQDATQGYPEWNYANGGKIYGNPGIKLLHADNRLGKVRYSARTGGYTFQGFTDTFVDSSTTYATIVSSNTPSVSLSGFRKLELICADGKNHFINKYGYENDFGKQSLLFGTSAYKCGSRTFDASTAAKIMSKKDSSTNVAKMNDGTDIPYGFEVIEQNDSSVTIKVVAL